MKAINTRSNAQSSSRLIDLVGSPRQAHGTNPTFGASLRKLGRSFWRPSLTAANFEGVFGSFLTRAVQGTTAVPTDSEVKGGRDCVLVGDIGGTNARLSLWKIGPGSEYTLVFQEWYPTADYREEGFVAVLEALMQQKEVQANPPATACFAVAGPVNQNRGVMTNLGWMIDGDAISKQFGWRVAVINDFEALGYGVPVLGGEDLEVLNDVPADEKAPIAVIGPGTGLGQANLMYDEGKGQYKVWPSEGSHSDFAPRGEKQIALMKWIVDGLGYCEVEHVACGSGLERIYTFLTARDRLSAADPPVLAAPEISKRALSGGDDAAVEALDLMLSILGAEAGGMGLRTLARGGVYIAGGITPKVIDRVKTGIVLENFLHREDHRFHPLLKTLRLVAVLNEEVGLIGARQYACSLLNSI